MLKFLASLKRPANLIKSGLLLIPLSLSLLTFPACKINFSFSGAKVPPDVKSISIQQFENNAPIVVATLSQDFTEKVRDFFTSRTNLQLVEQGGDLNLTGSINSYDITPLSLTGEDQAEQNRLTIRISAKMEAENHPDLNWEEAFSNFADFSADTDLSSVEGDLIEEVNEKIAQDIFNKTFANW